MKLTTNGFDLHFTKPVNVSVANNPAIYSVQRYYYEYHRSYGSPQMEITPAKIQKVTVSADARTVSIELAALVKERIYELNINGLKAADGADLLHPVGYYTLNKLIE